MSAPPMCGAPRTTPRSASSSPPIRASTCFTMQGQLPTCPTKTPIPRCWRGVAAATDKPVVVFGRTGAERLRGRARLPEANRHALRAGIAGRDPRHAGAGAVRRRRCGGSVPALPPAGTRALPSGRGPRCSARQRTASTAAAQRIGAIARGGGGARGGDRLSGRRSSSCRPMPCTRPSSAASRSASPTRPRSRPLRRRWRPASWRAYREHGSTASWSRRWRRASNSSSAPAPIRSTARSWCSASAASWSRC